MKGEQYVCLVCGFNMIGFHPDHCPFCGAAKKHFITADECSARYQVVGTPVNEKVTRLNSHPPLGLEHAAYLQAEIVMKPARPVFMDDESQGFFRGHE